MSDSSWYYSDAHNQHLGPFSIDQIRQLVASHLITRQTLLWREGLARWTPAGEIQGIFVTPAPAPAPFVSNSPPPSASSTSRREFPIPPIGKSSYRLFLASSLVAIALIIIASAFLLFAGKSAPRENIYNHNDLSHIEDAGVQPAPGIEDPRDGSESTVSSRNATLAFVSLLLFTLGGLLTLFGGIYAGIILYRAWFAIQPGGAQTTPGKAVGFLFIPLFNIYWFFVVFSGWANSWRRIRTSYSSLMAAPEVSSGLFLSGCILMLLFPPLGIFLFFAMISQMCAVTNYMASTYALAQTKSTGLTGTKFY